MKSGVKRGTVEFGGILLDCEFSYFPEFPGDQTDPPCGEFLEFHYVKHNGECIYGALADAAVEALQAVVIDAMKNDLLMIPPKAAAQTERKVPDAVMAALDRMCMPLHESRLSGVTAEVDARNMATIREYILGAAQPEQAKPSEPVFHLRSYGDVTAAELAEYEATGKISAKPEAKPVEAMQPQFLCKATRFKMSFDHKERVNCFYGHGAELDGRWVALVPAENDCHLAAAQPLQAQPAPEPNLCIKPACGTECSGCNSAISGDVMRRYAIRYAYLRDHDPRFGMPMAWLVFQTLDEAIDAAITKTRGAE